MIFTCVTVIDLRKYYSCCNNAEHCQTLEVNKSDALPLTEFRNLSKLPQDTEVSILYTNTYAYLPESCFWYHKYKPKE